MGIEIIDTAYVSSNLFSFHGSPAIVSERPIFFYKLIIAMCSVVRHHGNTRPADKQSPYPHFTRWPNQFFTKDLSVDKNTSVSVHKWYVWKFNLDFKRLMKLELMQHIYCYLNREAKPETWAVWKISSGVRLMNGTELYNDSRWMVGL